MLVLKRHYQFWFAILGLHKLGAVAIPATNQLQEHDFSYRFNSFRGYLAAMASTQSKAKLNRSALGKERLRRPPFSSSSAWLKDLHT